MSVHEVLSTPSVIEAVERKGIGHPDTLADLIAEEFSRLYSRYCLEMFGTILNHAVDKVNLVGAASVVTWGRYDIIKPITVHLFGKITERVGTSMLPIRELLSQATSRVLSSATLCPEITQHVTFNIENTAGVQLDHASAFYKPPSLAAAAKALQNETVANDTVLCTAYAMRNDIADLAIFLERLLTDPDRIPELRQSIGTDVKVCVHRNNRDVNITICVPIHPRCVNSRSDYDTLLSTIRAYLSARLQLQAEQHGFQRIALKINTKDTPHAVYIAPFGTSLGKGDCGAVGRGNRINGVINVLQPSTCEAPAGKNPLHHVGKLYTIGAQLIADELVRCGTSYAAVLLGTDNGNQLSEPTVVRIFADTPALPEDKVQTIVSAVIRFLPDYWRHFIDIDPLTAARERLTPILRDRVAGIADSDGLR